MNVLLVTAPTLEPITVQEVKEHLYIDGADNDVYVSTVVKAATNHVENWTRRAIMTQTWDYWIDAFPSDNYIILPFGNLQSVTSIVYKESDWVTVADDVTMTPTTDYLVETNGAGFGRIVLPYAGTWPSGTLYPSNPIKIRFVCGWTTQALVPFNIKAAVKLVCADLFEMRGEPTIGATVVPNNTIEALLASERLWGSF